MIAILNFVFGVAGLVLAGFHDGDAGFLVVGGVCLFFAGLDLNKP